MSLRLMQMLRSVAVATACAVLIARPAWAAPKLVPVEPTYDFGSVQQGDKAPFTFTLRNEGDSPLTIEEVKPSCGCTAALVSERVVPPGGEATITGEVRTAGFQDRISKTVTVLSDDPQSPQLTLTVTGTVDVPFRLEPRYLNFGQLKEGEGGTQTAVLHIADESKLPVTLGEPAVNQEHVHVSIAPRPGDPPREFDIMATIDPAAPQGVISSPITIPVEGEPEPLRLSVYANIVGSVALFPRTVSLGVLSDGTPVTRNFIVMSPTQTAFAVTGATCNLPGSSVQVSPLPNDPSRVRITVTVDASALPDGRVDGTLTVETDAADARTLTATLIGSVQRVAPQAAATEG